MTNKLPHVVLIVEHHELLKSLTADIIEEAGFTALQASGADEALAILKSRSDITVLLTSVTMQGRMDGLGLAHRVSKRWPDIKIIIASSQVQLMEQAFAARALSMTWDRRRADRASAGQCCLSIDRLGSGRLTGPCGGISEAGLQRLITVRS